MNSINCKQLFKRLTMFEKKKNDDHFICLFVMWVLDVLMATVDLGTFVYFTNWAIT